MSRYKVGDSIIVGKTIREIIRLVPNDNNELVIHWKSKNDEGACITALWDEWTTGEREDY